MPSNPRDASPTSRTRQPTRGTTPRTPLGDVFERVSDAVVALDRNWHYTYVNRRAAELFGRQPEELLGRHIWTVFPEGVGQPFQLAYERAMAEQVFIQIENHYEPWDRWFENRIYPSPDGVSIFFHEISDRKHAEQAARENAALLEGQSRILECIARGEQLEPTLDALLGVVEAQSPGIVCSVLVLDRRDPGRVQHTAARSLPRGFVSPVEGGPMDPLASAFATAALRSDPVYVEDIATDALWHEHRDLALEHGLRAAWATPIMDAHGEVLGSLVAFSRVTGRPSERDRRLIETATHTAAIAVVNERQVEARRASESRLRLAVTGGNVGIWEWDVLTNRLVGSDQFTAMFGWTPTGAGLALETFVDIIHPDDRARIEEALRRSVVWGVDYDVEYRIVRADGSLRWIASKGSGEYDAGSTPVRIMGVALDITDRKEAANQLEAAVELRTVQLHDKNRELQDEMSQRERVGELLRRRNEELKAFAYTVSHDLKAPLRGIAGYANELDRRHRAGLDDRGGFCVEQILRATRNLDSLIEDLLQYSRLDAATPTPTDLDIAHIVEGVLSDCRPLILEQQVDVTLDLSVTHVEAWERGLTQVLTNLIGNALKYSRHAKPPRVQVASRCVSGAVRIRVSDNGIGFDMKYHDRIFGLFNRLVRQEEFDGTGAGLAIVKKVVEKMNGSLWAESAPGAGATFFVELPGRTSQDR